MTYNIEWKCNHSWGHFGHSNSQIQLLGYFSAVNWNRFNWNLANLSDRNSFFLIWRSPAPSNKNFYGQPRSTMPIAYVAILRRTCFVDLFLSLDANEKELYKSFTRIQWMWCARNRTVEFIKYQMNFHYRISFSIASHCSVESQCYSYHWILFKC